MPLGVVLSRKVLTTDASLSGWGDLFEERAVNGKWDPHMRLSHINYLELLAVHLSLKYFLPFLRGHHVFVQTDNTTVVAYINKRGPEIPSVAHAGTQTDCLEQLTYPVPEGHSCTGGCCTVEQCPEATLFMQNGNFTQMW